MKAKDHSQSSALLSGKELFIKRRKRNIRCVISTPLVKQYLARKWRLCRSKQTLGRKEIGGPWGKRDETRQDKTKKDEAKKRKQSQEDQTVIFLLGN